MNKLVLIISCFVFSSSVLFAQSLKTKEVPKNITSLFKVKNRFAKSVSWEKDENTYVVSFTEDKIHVKGYYEASGEWIKNMFDVEREDLPTNIINYIKKNHASYTRLEEIYFVKQEKQKDYYLVDVIVLSEKIISTMKFTVTGRYVSEEKKDMPESVIAEESKKQNESVVEKASDDVKKGGKGKKSESLDPDLINNDKIPAVVFKTFKKRFMNASNVKWYKKREDTIYRVTCVLRGENAEGYITQGGEWISTISKLNSSKLPSAIYKSINEFYSEYTIITAWNEIRADKNNQFIVDVVEGKNKKSDLITKMYFDTRAKIIKIIDAEVPKEKKVEISEKEKKAQRKMEKEFQKHQKMKYDPSNINETELPSGVGLWIAKEYPEYLVRKAEYKEFDEYPEHGNIYKILIERPGVNQPHAIGYFTHNGKLINVIDDFKKEEPEKEVKREVTKAIVAAFKKQNPKVDKVRWEEGDEGTWIAVYTEKKLEKKATYTENATWLETKLLIDSDAKIPSSIRNYVLKKLPGKEIQSCYLVEKPDVKPYYTITLYEKKIKTSTDLDFTKSGKLIE